MTTIKKECQVILVPRTDNYASTILKHSQGLSLFKSNPNFKKEVGDEFMELYVLSDEQINQIDESWVVDLFCLRDNLPDVLKKNESLTKGTLMCCKKIIATTNSTVVVENNGVPSPSPTKEFLQEWITKGCPNKIYVEFQQYWEKINDKWPNFPQFRLLVDKNNAIACFIEKEATFFTEEDINLAIQFGKDIRSEKSFLNYNFGEPYIDYDDSTEETIAFMNQLKLSKK